MATLESVVMAYVKASSFESETKEETSKVEVVLPSRSRVTSIFVPSNEGGALVISNGRSLEIVSPSGSVAVT